MLNILLFCGSNVVVCRGDVEVWDAGVRKFSQKYLVGKQKGCNFALAFGDDPVARRRPREH